MKIITLKFCAVILPLLLLLNPVQAQMGIGTTSPNSTLDVRGSIATSYRSFTGATTVSATDNIVVFTGTSATTVTLPTAVGCGGRNYVIKNASTTGPTPLLTVATTSSQTIDGTSTWLLDEANETVSVISDGSNWKVSAQTVPPSLSTNWSQDGNTVAALKTLGTVNNYDVPFITNNTEKMRLTTSGRLGIATTAANSTLDVRGSVATNYRSFTSATTVAATDNLVVFTGTTATTVTLPTAVGCDGRNYVIKNASTTGPTPLLTVATTSSQTIDGASSWLLDDPYETVTVISDGTNWKIAGQTLPTGSGTNWSQGGNSVASLKQLGTINNYDVPFITNNTEKMRLTATGRLGIGTSTFDATNPEKLLVDAGTTSSYNVISGKGTIDNYLQLNIQNRSAGNSASSDVVATSDNGNETTNYIDMGINSSTYNAASFNVTAANDAYLYSTGNDLAIGNATTNKALKFFTGGTLSGNERMRIDGSGNVGIGTTTIPRGGVGAAKFAINGANGSVNGPHMQFTTSADNYPQLQVLPWMHDNTFMMFDSYWDGSNWKSSTSSGGNFMLTKTAGLFQLNYANTNTQGATIPGFYYGLTMDPNGSVGIGTASFDATNPEQLLVDAGSTSSYNVISGKGSIDNYLQLNIQNRSNTANASSDVVATAANGNESVNFIDMGINSGNYSNTGSPILNGANNAYLYSTGNDFVIGNGTASKNVIFFNGGYASTNEKLRIHSSGNVGVATAAPTSSFQVTGSVAMSTVTKTANYTATASDYSIICNNTGGAITISLPAAAGCAGRVYCIKKISTILLNVTIDPNGSETIDGALTRVMSTQWEGVMIQSDGTNWVVISKI